MRSQNVGRIAVLVVVLAALCLGGVVWATAPYHGNTDSLIFHKSSCRYFSCKSCTREFNTREEAIKAGYQACKVCNP